MPTIAEAFQQARARWAFEGAKLVEAEVREGLDEGRYGLKSDTGNLKNRTLGELLPERDGFRTGTNVEYGRAWELGFTSPAHEITPKRAKVLAFPYRGKTVFAKRVRIPAKTFPARPWLYPAIQKMTPELQVMAENVFQSALVRSFPDRKIEI